MTKREFYATIVEGAVITAEQADYALDLIEKLDDRNSKRATNVKAKNEEVNAPLRAKISEILADGEVKTASELAKLCDCTTQKVSGVIKAMDNLTVTEVKLKGGRKVKGYSITK